MLDQLQRNIVDALSDDLDASVVDADDVAFLDFLVLKDGIAHRERNLTGLNLLGSGSHGFAVFLRAHLRIEGDDRADAHRNVLRRQNNDVPFGKLRRLRSRENDVGVVRQNEHGLCADLLHRVEDVLDARVHGLTAFNDVVNAQIAEDAREAFAQRNGNHAVFLERLLFLGGFLLLLFFGSGLLCLLRLLQAFTAFLSHVVNFHVNQFAQLAGILNRLAGVIGMYMNLDQREIADNHNAVADARQARAEFVDIVLGNALVHVLDNELRAVFELDFIHGFMVVLKFKGRRAADIRARILNLFSVERGAPALEHGQQSLSAGVHNARLLERREHVRRLFKDGFAAADDLIQQLGQVARMLGHIAGGILRDDADYRQNRAFLRLHDRLVRRVRAGSESFGERFGVDGLRAVDSAGKAAQNLRKDNARVAARALECAARRHAQQLAGIVFVHGCDFLDR